MRRPFGTASLGCCFGSGRDANRRIPRKNPGYYHPDTECDEIRRELLCLCGMEGNGARVLRAELRGVL